jgi:hypothetical protein
LRLGESALLRCLIWKPVELPIVERPVDLQMDRDQVIQLEPDPNRKVLSDRAKAAAIFLGGEDIHLITVAEADQRD